MPRKTLFALVGGGALVVFIVGIALFQVLSPLRDSLPDGTTLSVLSGEVAVQKAGENSFSRAVNGTSLEAEDHVRTGKNARALITFFEGSTAVIEADSEMAITSLLKGRGARQASTAVAFRQISGVTWNKVLPNDQSSLYEITSATSVVQGFDATFLVRVEESGRTETQVFNGTASVRALAQGTRVQVNRFNSTVVDANQQPSQPSQMTPAAERLVFTIDPAVWARVIDREGRSVGFVSPGLPINQVPGAMISAITADPMTIELPVSESDRYDIVLEGAQVGSYRFIVQGISRDQPAFIQGVEGTTLLGQRFHGVLSTVTQNGHISSGKLDAFVALNRDQGPGTFVRTQIAVTSIRATATAMAGGARRGTPTSLPITPTSPPSTTATTGPASSATTTATVPPTPIILGTATPSSTTTAATATPSRTATLNPSPTQPPAITTTPNPSPTQPPAITATPIRTPTPAVTLTPPGATPIPPATPTPVSSATPPGASVTATQAATPPRTATPGPPP